MTFERYFKFCSFCMIASGFVAIASTGKLDVVSIVLFGSTLIAGWFLDTSRMQQRIPRWVPNSIALAYVPLYILDYKQVSQSFVISTVHFVLFIAAIKVLTLSRDRDYAYLYLISFAQILAASILTIDLVFILSFFLFLASGVATLILFEMRRSNALAQKLGKIQPLVVLREAGGTGFELFSSFPARTLTWISIGISVLILLLSVPLFLVLPRIALGISARPRGRTQLVSGFSERVELGEIGTIKESDAIVMRVKLGGPPSSWPDDLKFRGVALDYYDGRSWSRSDLRRYNTYVQAPRPAASANFFQLESSAFSSNVLNQTFYLEALSTNVVFAAHKVLAVSSDLGMLQRDSGGSLFTAFHPFNKIRYTAVSDITNPDPNLIVDRSDLVPENIKSQCLQVPREDPRIAELAKELTQSVANPYYKARVLENHLRTRYGYSLELRGSPNSADPLAMFLFDVRKGHCEYFASAMAIMLRQIGIPARLVNGFRAGDYNRLGGDWTVRQYNAHSWVEAYMTPYGWVEFDPTPAEPQRARSGVTRMVTNLFDAVDLWWAEEVVNYDTSKQYRILDSFRSGVLSASRRIKETFRELANRATAAIGALRSGRIAPHAVIEWLAGTASALGLTLLYLRFGKNLRRAFTRAIHPGDGGVLIPSFYSEALDLMQASGWIRRRDQTPLEFARSLQPHPAGSTFERLTQIYNRSRFGALAASQDLPEAEALLNALRIGLRRGRK